MALIAAYLHAALSAVTVAFQFALIGGAPWGHLTMGGQVKGALPLGMRLVAGASAVLLVAVAWIVLRHAGGLGAGPAFGRAWLIWLPVGVAAFTCLGNAITRSAPERRLWLPIALGLLGSSLTVALGATP